MSARAASAFPIAWPGSGRSPGLEGGSPGWLARRIDTGTPKGFLLSFVVLAGTICGWVFVALTQDVVANEEAARLVPDIERFVLSHRAVWGNAVMEGITWLGSDAVLVPLVVGIGGYFLVRRRNWRPGLFLTGALGGAVVLYEVVEPLVGRSRPPVTAHLIAVSGFAFPSGHATAAVAVWGAIAAVLAVGRVGSVRIALWATAAVIAILVSLSRLYLGLHWWTDVVGGMALGGLWLSVLSLTLVGGRVAPQPAPRSQAPG